MANILMTASYKHPKRGRLIHFEIQSERGLPQEIVRNNNVYLLYGIHRSTIPEGYGFNPFSVSRSKFIYHSLEQYSKNTNPLVTPRLP